MSLKLREIIIEKRECEETDEEFMNILKDVINEHDEAFRGLVDR